MGSLFLLGERHLGAELVHQCTKFGECDVYGFGGVDRDLAGQGHGGDGQGHDDAVVAVAADRAGRKVAPAGVAADDEAVGPFFDVGAEFG